MTLAKSGTNKAKTNSFIFETEILSSEDSFSALGKSSEFGRKLYNSVLGVLLKNLRIMRASKAYQEALLLKKGSPVRKAAFDQLRIEHGLTKYAAVSLSSKLRTGSMDFDLYIPSKVAQEIGKRAFISVEKKMFGKSKRCRFKKAGTDFSLRGSSNAESPQIKFGESTASLIFRKKHYPLKIDLENPFHAHAMVHRVKNAIVFKRVIGLKERWFVQICLEGDAYRDQSKELKHKHSLKKKFGDDFRVASCVSVDFGPKKIAISNSKVSYERVIVKDYLEEMLLESKTLQRRMSRSIRLNNKKAFKEGSLKKGFRLHKTSSYRLVSAEKRDLDRRIAAYRKCIHGNLSNEIMQLGCTIKLENISYLALQKRYGKSVGQSAPASLKASLFRTAEKLGGKGQLINTFQTRLSQTCLCGEIKKKLLSERTHNCPSCGLKVQRDILSAYLGCFTTNTETKNGRKTTITSSLDLVSARSAANGNKTFSAFGSPSSDNVPSENFKDQSICRDREEAPSLEKLKKRRSRNLQEPLLVPKTNGNVRASKRRESPSIATGLGGEV